MEHLLLPMVLSRGISVKPLGVDLHCLLKHGESPTIIIKRLSLLQVSSLRSDSNISSAHPASKIIHHDSSTNNRHHVHHYQQHQ
jgi:hypothetical protein